MFLDELNFLQTEMPWNTFSFLLSWMNVFTLDENYSLCSHDMCLPEKCDSNITKSFSYYDDDCFNGKLERMKWAAIQAEVSQTLPVTHLSVRKLRCPQDCTRWFENSPQLIVWKRGISMPLPGRKEGRGAGTHREACLDQMKSVIFQKAYTSTVVWSNDPIHKPTFDSHNLPKFSPHPTPIL